MDEKVKDKVKDKTSEVLLRVSNIDVLHGAFQALWDVTLEVYNEEIIALIGANGSGKSTLLDAVSGFLHPAHGRIYYAGIDITNAKPYQIVDMGIAHVPEGRRIFPEMSVLNNLIIGSYNKRAKAKRDENLQKIYELFPILRLRKNQHAKNLSGGEQQMLAIGRGLMASPRIILLDEISLGLAPIVLNDLYNTLHQIRARGITILFVEQNVKRSLMEADRAYVMEAGHIVLSGTVEDLKQESEIKKAYFGV
jgi:branched-chain amino acid transport system ATP-binding protein